MLKDYKQRVDVASPCDYKWLMGGCWKQDLGARWHRIPRPILRELVGFPGELESLVQDAGQYRRSRLYTRNPRSSSDRPNGPYNGK